MNTQKKLQNCIQRERDSEYSEKALISRPWGSQRTQTRCQLQFSFVATMTLRKYICAVQVTLCPRKLIETGLLQGGGAVVSLET